MGMSRRRLSIFTDTMAVNMADTMRDIVPIARSTMQPQCVAVNMLSYIMMLHIETHVILTLLTLLPHRQNVSYVNRHISKYHLISIRRHQYI